MFVTIASVGKKAPYFSDEVKIQLPLIKPEHHLLLQVYHVETKKPKKGEDEIEAIVGYCVLPLTEILTSTSHSMALIAGKPIPGYRKVSERDLVDSGKAILKLRTLLLSSIYTQNPDLNAFYKLIKGGDSDLAQAFQRLRNVPIEDLQKFFPIIVRELVTQMSTHPGAVGVQIFKVFMFVLNKLNK